MSERTHPEVPVPDGEASCLGPDGSATLVAAAIAMLDERWKLPILFRLFLKPSMRFSELLHGIAGVSHKMLTRHLRELEADGLVTRTDHGEQPPRVEYRLSPKGQRLREPLMALRDFARDDPPREPPA